jgi:hypothetical protein
MSAQLEAIVASRFARTQQVTISALADLDSVSRENSAWVS